MQKVYLILRNNKQLGPYTLDELIAFGVKQTDLIWVEGKSAAWRYPPEIKELQPDAAEPTSNIKQAPPAENRTDQKNHTTLIAANSPKGEKKVFVSMPFQPRKEAAPTTVAPEDALEQKAEALRQKLQAYIKPTDTTTDPQLVETNYARSLQAVEEDYTNWKLKQAKKKNTFAKKQKMLLAIAAAIVIVVPLYFLLKPAAAPAHLAEKEVAKKEVSSITTLITPSDTDVAMPENAVVDVPQTESIKANSAAKQNSTSSKPAFKTAKPLADSEAIIAQTNTDEEPIAEKATDKEVNNNATPEGSKKKTIGEAIDGFFGKFKSKKKEEPASTGPDAEGVRHSNKRTEAQDATAPDAEQLEQQVTITATEPAENWMLGLKGLKLTLHNESNFKLSKAAVEVSYFNEENTLLEKKTVLFQNVPAHKAITLAAPDHRLASYAKHQLLSVSGE